MQRQPIQEQNSNSKKPKNRFEEELDKCLQQEVTICLDKETKVEGVLRGYNSHLNLAVMTKDEKIILRNWLEIRRKRQTGDR